MENFDNYFSIRTIGQNAVIIGRSHNVGLSIQILLGADSSKGGFDMTTTLCHRYTPVQQLHRALASADIVVTAAGMDEIFVDC